MVCSRASKTKYPVLWLILITVSIEPKTRFSFLRRDESILKHKRSIDEHMRLSYLSCCKLFEIGRRTHTGC
jgi:hypothetical protein